MIDKKRIKIRNIFQMSEVGASICVWGWIRTARFSRDISFILLNDGSDFKSLQLVIEHDKVKFDRQVIRTGVCIRAEGVLTESAGSEQPCELNVSAIEIVGPVDDEYPIQKKKHSFEFLRNLPHLRNRTNTYSAVFSIRSHLSYAIHKFFYEKGFKYVHTPIITTNDCEGAGETFRVTTLDSIDRYEGQNAADDFFGNPVFLTVSGQLEAEAFALSHGEVYTFGPTFRADPSTTPRHAAEFWMIEPEMAFYDLEDLREIIEAFVKSITEYIECKCRTEIQFLAKHVDDNIMERYSTITHNKFEVIDFAKAIEMLGKNSHRLKTKPSVDSDLTAEQEIFLTDIIFKKPIFIQNYPLNIKPFYMRLNDDNLTVACLDLLIPHIGEIITGSQREERYDILERRILMQKMDKKSLNWYLSTRKWGTAPHAGFGLGLERMLMYLTGMNNIRDVIPFPRAGGRVF